MFTAIGTGFLAILPALIKIVVWIIDKFSKNDKLKEAALKFLSDFNKEIPISIHDSYVSQIDDLEKKLREENDAKNLNPSG